MTDFDSLRWKLAELLPEMRRPCGRLYVPATGVSPAGYLYLAGDTYTTDHTVECPGCHGKNYTPLSVFGDSTTSWMAVLIGALGSRNWEVERLTIAGCMLQGNREDSPKFVSAVGDNPDHALAAAAVKALEARKEN